MTVERGPVRWDDVAKSLDCSEAQLLRSVLAPSPRGYVLGALSEILLQDALEAEGFESVRIVEKPPGGFREKRSDARGDLYVRRHGSSEDQWWVVECKGLKSNAEKHIYRDGISRDAAFNYLAARAFPRAGHADKRYARMQRDYESARAKYVSENPAGAFPSLHQNPDLPGAEVYDLGGLWADKRELRAFLESLPDVAFTTDFLRGRGVFSLLQTHKPNRRKCPQTGITQAAPLRADFSVLAVDLFLRTGRHEFVFAASTRLNTSPSSPSHLYQNYTIDILVRDIKREPRVHLPWRTSFSTCVAGDSPWSVGLDETQVDRRSDDLSTFLDPVDDVE
ncbi:MAG: hypothetical protein KDB73_12245 [Planctomycetes bacterium]|nr:hypothetical protein [Planctomycetota bacterium]